jgi:hypothetical protein
MKIDFETRLNNKRRIRLISFLISIVPTSVAVSFASFIGNSYLLSIALFPCIITLSISIIPTPVNTKSILISGVVSFFVSVIVIIYTLIAHAVLLKPYLTLSF